MTTRGLLLAGPELYLSREKQERVEGGHIAHVPLFVIMYIHRDLSLYRLRSKVYLIF